MVFRPRPTVRFWMLAVAVVAIFLAANNELKYRRMRDSWAVGEALARRFEAEQERERAFCLEHQGTPYDKQDREARYPAHAIWPQFLDWLDEANQHAEWAKSHRQTAEASAARKRDAERHLIFP